MLRLFAFVFCVLLSGLSSAQENTRYISENIYIYLHAGPGSQFKILGSVAAGKAITSLEKIENGYAKIVDDKGREGWVQAKMLTNKPTFRVTQPQLEQQLADIQQSLSENGSKEAQLTEQLQQATDKLSLAEKAKHNAEKELAHIQEKTKQELAQLQAQVTELKDDAKYQFWREGGMIAGIGLLIGLVLAYLPRPSRQRKTRW
ncbi:TIGR04211 family SH3 domain-containing protein [Parashewanella tropica]|uniref:TIGR04211 family SH3 domain-containing protein n=1 Tax=Parashewanella tropica TaxID=2547970 RepID=UPI001478F733|nr:TIGR04211 family SH3 domain-containing protein [Parashewanella tropica]